MRIRRFAAKEMRAAIRLVRDELGPDAVILSNRKVEGGVEVVAAADYEAELESGWSEPLAPAPAGAGGPEPLERRAVPPSGSGDAPVTASIQHELKDLRDLLEHQLSGLAWGEFGRRHPVRAGVLRRLMQLGLTRAIADPIAAETQGAGDVSRAWRRALAVLVERIPVSDDDVLSRGGLVALLGPTGVGKTTTVAKLAARFRLRHGPESVALLTTDNFRVGAEGQLRTYGQLMGVPVAGCAQAAEMEEALARYRDRRLVLVDTAGMSQRDLRLTEQVRLLQRAAGGQAERLRCHLVLSAATAYWSLEETVAAYGGLPLDGALITKLDEATSLGGVISALLSAGLPAAYVCDGQRVPEDLAPARARQLVSDAVRLARQHHLRSAEAVELAYGGFLAHA